MEQKIELKKLLEEQKIYDKLRENYSNNENQYIDIRKENYDLIRSCIPDQGLLDQNNAVYDAIMRFFMDLTSTRLETLKTSLELVNRNFEDAYDRCRETYDDYFCERFSYTSAEIFRDCILEQRSEYGIILEDINQEARQGAYLIAEKATLETVKRLAKIAEELGMNLSKRQING